MAVHKINIRANTLEKSKAKAPFLGVYQSNGTNNEEAMLPHVAEAAGQKDIQTRAILEGVFAAISKKNRADGPTRMHLPGGISAFVGITGSFPASDSSFDPERNKVVQILGLSPKLRNELVNVTPEIVGEADGTRIELNRVFDLAQKTPPAVIYGKRPFRCQGINIVTTDEDARVFIRNRKGVEFDVVVDEVVSTQEFTAHTAELLEPGDYYVVIETRGGNPDGTIREVDKPVKYLKVIDPPTVDDIASEGHEGEIVSGTAFAAKGSGLDAFDAESGDTVKVKWTQGGEDKEALIDPADIAADKLSFEFPDALVGVPMDTELTFEITFGEVHKTKGSKLVSA